MGGNVNLQNNRLVKAIFLDFFLHYSIINDRVNSSALFFLYCVTIVSNVEERASAKITSKFVYLFEIWFRYFWNLLSISTATTLLTFLARSSVSCPIPGPTSITMDLLSKTVTTISRYFES